MSNKQAQDVSSEPETQPTKTPQLVHPEAATELQQILSHRRSEELDNLPVIEIMSRGNESAPAEVMTPKPEALKKPKINQAQTDISEPEPLTEPELTIETVQGPVELIVAPDVETEIIHKNTASLDVQLPDPQEVEEFIPVEAAIGNVDIQESGTSLGDTDRIAAWFETSRYSQPDEAADQGFEDYVKHMDDETAQRFESLDEDDQDKAFSILTEMTDLAREVREIRKKGNDGLREIEQTIIGLCEDLFEAIGLEYDEQTIDWFVHNIVYIDMPPGQELSNLGAFIEEGTHEQLNADFHLLSKLLQMVKMPPRLHLLGRIALRFRPLFHLAVSV